MFIKIVIDLSGSIKNDGYIHALQFLLTDREAPFANYFYKHKCFSLHYCKPLHECSALDFQLIPVNC